MGGEYQLSPTVREEGAQTALIARNGQKSGSKSLSDKDSGQKWVSYYGECISIKIHMSHLLTRYLQSQRRCPFIKHKDNRKCANESLNTDIRFPNWYTFLDLCSEIRPP